MLSLLGGCVQGGILSEAGRHLGECCASALSSDEFYQILIAACSLCCDDPSGIGCSEVFDAKRLLVS
jgi:hypothetical protein